MSLAPKLVFGRNGTEQRATVCTPEAGMLMRVGSGESTAHHGEVFQGQIEDRQSRKRRCLVTLPCPIIASKAVFHPQRNCGIQVFRVHMEKARRVLELALAWLRNPDVGGVLSIESN